jgi:hypothetical protein
MNFVILVFSTISTSSKSLKHFKFHYINFQVSAGDIVGTLRIICAYFVLMPHDNIGNCLAYNSHLV